MLRVGEALVDRGSPEALGLVAYAGAAFAQVVAEVLALADRIGLRLSGDDEAPARRHFTVTAAMSGCSGTPPGDQRSGR